MRKSFFLLSIAVAVMVSLFASCDNEKVDLTTGQTTEVVKKGYTSELSLIHSIDSTAQIRVVDDMTATIQSWRLQDGKKGAEIYNRKHYPKMTAYSDLAKKNYAISAEMLNITAMSTTISRGSEEGENGAYTELDTVKITFPDGQLKYIPVKITNEKVEITSDLTLDVPSLTLSSAEFVSLRNTDLSLAKTRATYVSAEYSTEYKTMLHFKEKNITNAQTISVPIYAVTERYVVSEDDVVKADVTNKNREVIDSVSEKCEFDIVYTYASGETVTEHKEIVLNREFSGIEPYEKIVSDLNYSFSKSNGIVDGSEDPSREEDGWSVWSKVDKYSADIENGYDDDKIVTDYSFMHERCVYQQDTISVEFPYVDVTTTEISTVVGTVASDKTGYIESVVENNINTTYLGYDQGLREIVYVYMKSKEVAGHEIQNPKIKILQDSVVADLDFVTKYDDGTSSKEHEHFKAPRSLVVNSDWTTIQKVLFQETDTIVNVAINNKSAEEDGYWKYDNETRSLDCNVHFQDGASASNLWTSIVPNSIRYVREGVTYEFDVIDYTVSQRGASLKFRGEEQGYKVYDYSDLIEENFGGYVQNSTAPGTLKLLVVTISGFDIRNKKLEIERDKVSASFTFVTNFSDGTKNEEMIAREFPRSLVVNSDWTANEASAAENTSHPSAAISEQETLLDGEWSWVQETRAITSETQLTASKQINSWTAVDPNNIKFIRNGEVVDFGKIEHSVGMVSHATTLISSEGLKETHKYEHLIDVKYGSHSQTTVAPGTINVEKEKTILGYRIMNPFLTVNQNDVFARLTYVTMWSDGSETSEEFTNSFARNFSVLTNWSSIEENNSQTTGSANTVLASSSDRTDGDWSYVSETRNIKTIAQLAGSSQENAWQSVDPNKISFSRNGESYSFDILSFNATETGANVNLASDTETASIYNYVDNLSVGFGSNMFTSQANGKITVQKELWTPDFPSDYGPVVSSVVTTARNEASNDWVYVVSVHFKNGTLPLIIRKEASAPEVNFDYFETDTDSRINSATWISAYGKWLNTVADDGVDRMEWTRLPNKNADSMPYPTATQWGWDYGHQKGGHPTVFTDKFSVQVTGNGSILTIYKDGREFASFKAAKN